jgi:hypothetical protein
VNVAPTVSLINPTNGAVGIHLLAAHAGDHNGAIPVSATVAVTIHALLLPPWAIFSV